MNIMKTKIDELWINNLMEKMDREFFICDRPISSKELDVKLPIKKEKNVKLKLFLLKELENIL